MSAAVAVTKQVAILKAEKLEKTYRIGKVDVDHGETSCKTPDAVAYIERASS